MSRTPNEPCPACGEPQPGEGTKYFLMVEYRVFQGTQNWIRASCWHGDLDDKGRPLYRKFERAQR